jgi:hypothetical protein
MEELIEALKILLKYSDRGEWPTHCEHDVLYVYDGIDVNHINKDELKRLDELGFSWDKELECFYSYKFGSC